MATNEPVRPQTFEQAYPGRFVSAKQLPADRPITVTIADVIVEQLEGEKGKEAKVIATFRERSKTTGAPLQLVLAKINAQCVVAMFGKRIADWYGKRLALYATDKLMPYPGAKGDDRFCVRVWGSPDIERDMSIQIKMPRRQPITVTLYSTRKGAVTEPAPAEAAPAGPVCPGCGASVADLDPGAQEYVQQSGTCPSCPKT